jgi:hypothetical protein
VVLLNFCGLHAGSLILEAQNGLATDTGVGRQWAAQYEPGDVVRYSKGSHAMGIRAGEYATVEGCDRERNLLERNLLTVERENSERMTYDPRRLQGVTVYRESERSFSEGDRVQFPAPDKDRHIANRELGTIESIDEHGNAQIKLDSGREVRLSLEGHPHLDYGYAVTSHSSQGATTDRVLVNVDSEQAGEQLINLAYVCCCLATMRKSTPTTPAISAIRSAARCPTRQHSSARGPERRTGPNQGTTAEKRKTTATITPRATGTRWPWSNPRT